MSDLVRKTLIGVAVTLLLVVSIWIMVWGVDLAHSRLETTRHTNPVHGTLYHLVASWFAVVVTLFLLRRPAVALLPLRAILGMLLMQFGWSLDASVPIGVGAAVVLHSLVCLVWRTRATGRGIAHTEAPSPRWRIASYALCLALMQGLLLMPFPVAGGRFSMDLMILGLVGLLGGFFAALAWHPDPRRKRLLSSPMSLYRKRGAARLMALRLFQAGAGFMLLALGAWWWQRGEDGSEEAAGLFPVWTLLAVTAAAGITMGVPVVTRLHPGDRRSRGHRRHRVRPLVVDSPPKDEVLRSVVGDPDNSAPPAG